ncbi:MAG: tRNA preQ1(34) S-adenosylmethionine ribosyltransferase-isomerase QueA, partial [Cyanobacteria bacterium J06632_3]
MTDLPADNTLDYQLSAYDYVLPEERIAQNPVVPRDRAKLLVIDSSTTHQHSHFYQLGSWLRPSDLLVLNDTKVIPARLFGRKATGGNAEVLLIEPLDGERWLALVRPGRRIQPGTEVLFSDEAEVPLLKAVVLSRDEPTGGRIVQLVPMVEGTVDALIHRLGQVPLPPYITQSESLPEQYQTVYAQREGAIAAPTAGLHFTETLLNQLTEKGIQTAKITLHVGIGTFRPVEATDIKTHEMHEERIEVSAETVEKIRETKANGGRI